MEKKEFKIGEVFQFGMVKLKCIKADNDYQCNGCYIDSVDCCNRKAMGYLGVCCSEDRTDNTDVRFVKVE